MKNTSIKAILFGILAIVFAAGVVTPATTRRDLHTSVGDDAIKNRLDLIGRGCRRDTTVDVGRGCLRQRIVGVPRGQSCGHAARAQH